MISSNIYHECKQVLDELASVEYDCYTKNHKMYVLAPEVMMKLKIGTCWDQAWYTYNRLCKVTKTHGYFWAWYDNNKRLHTHSTVLCEDGSKCYWVEHAWEAKAGIHVYTSRHRFENEIEKMLTDNDFVIKKTDAIYSRLNTAATKYHGIVPDNIYWKAITS